MELTVNADDLGKSHEINCAILQAFKLGYIDRASLLVNMNATHEAVEMIREAKLEDRVCFHLNLGEGQPLTDEIKGSGLCDATGKFKRYGIVELSKRCWKPAAIRSIRAEVVAQMKKFRGYGFRSPRLDSHFWTHATLPIALVVIMVARKYGFLVMRTMNGHAKDTGCKLQNSDGRSSVATLKQKLYIWVIASIWRIVRMNDEQWSGCPCEFLVAPPRGKSVCKVEVYVHPGMVNGCLVDRVFGYRSGEVMRMSDEHKLIRRAICNE